MDKELLEAFRQVIREETAPLVQRLDTLEKNHGTIIRGQLVDMKSFSALEKQIDSLAKGQDKLLEKVDYMSVVLEGTIDLFDNLNEKVKNLETMIG